MPLLKSEHQTFLSIHDCPKMTQAVMRVWFQAFRPKTLTAAIVPVVVGTALVHFQAKTIYWSMSFFALLSALFIQIGTNLFNDAIDFLKGADTAERIGPQRVSQGGLVSIKMVFAGGFLSFILALLCGIPLVLQGGWPLIVIGLVSLVLGYAYTGGPFPLAYLGLGDLFVILFFGLIAVAGVHYLHVLEWSPAALYAGLQVGVLATVLIAINNLRDVEQDIKAHKKTLAVRFGVGFARSEISILIFMAFAMQIYWWLQGAYWAAFLPLFTFPLALKTLKGVWQNQPGQVYNRFLAQAAALHLIFGLNLAVGLWLAP